MKSLLGLLMFGMAMWLGPMGSDPAPEGWTQQGGGVPSAVVDMGSYLVMGQGAGVVSIDVADPTHPRLVGSLVMPQMVRSVAASGECVVVVVCNPRFGPSPAVPCGLRILKLAGDGSLSEVSRLDLVGVLAEVVAQPGRAYVAAKQHGIHVVDLRDAAKPVLATSFGAISGVTKLAIAGTQLAVGSDSGVAILDTTDPLHPRVLGQVALSGNIGQLILYGDAIYAIVEDQDSGQFTLWLIDIHDLGNRPTVRRLQVDGGVDAMAVTAGRLFVATPSQLLTLDVTTPTIPAPVASSDVYLLARALMAHGRHLYAAAGGGAGASDRWILGGLHVVDVTDPGKALVVGSYESAERVGAVAFLDADHVASALSCSQFMGAELWTLRLADDHDPSLPRRAGPAPLARAGVSGTIWDLQPRDGLLYVAAWNTDVAGGGLRIVDVVNPESPGAVGKQELPQGATGLALSGTTAYLIGQDEVYVVDVSRPANPTLIGQVSAAPRLTSVAVDETGRLLVVGHEGDFGSGQTSGLQFFDASDSPALRLEADLGLSGRPERIVIRGDIAWVGAGAEILAVNTAVAADPRIVGRWPVAGYITGLAVADGWLVATGTSSGGYLGRLWAARLLSSDRLSDVEELQLPDVAWSLVIDHGRIVVGDDRGGLLIGRLEDLFGFERPAPTATASPPATAHLPPTSTSTTIPPTPQATVTRRSSQTNPVYLPLCAAMGW